NDQLIRYAGYRTPDGVVGDPANADLTEVAGSLGWPGGPGGPFDLLPPVIDAGEGLPPRFPVPPAAALEVPITPPALPWLADLGLRWHAVPAICGMVLEIGGVRYPAAPFNGWYMGTEIGARNFGDTTRYDLLPAIAQRLGLDITDDTTLW